MSLLRLSLYDRALLREREREDPPLPALVLVRERDEAMGRGALWRPLSACLCDCNKKQKYPLGTACSTQSEIISSPHLYSLTRNRVIMRRQPPTCGVTVVSRSRNQVTCSCSRSHPSPPSQLHIKSARAVSPVDCAPLLDTKKNDGESRQLGRRGSVLDRGCGPQSRHKATPARRASLAGLGCD